MNDVIEFVVRKNHLLDDVRQVENIQKLHPCLFANYSATHGMVALRFSKNSLNTPPWRRKKPKKTVPSIRRRPSHNNDP